MRSFSHSLRQLALATAAIPALAAAPAVAQSGDGAAATQNDDAGDIIVTARRREESLQDVPIAVTAFSGAQLEAAGALDITDIGNVTPNTTLENSRGTNSTLTAFIRGIGQQDPVAGFEAGVGIYLDDVYLNRPQASVLDIYDVERIEVLRGPQGTLYGRNTIGGAIKYVTRRLPDHFSVRARATYGSFDQADGTLSVSAPISDLIRIGAGIARLSRGGFGTNTNLGIANYNKDVWAGRATVEMGGHGQPVEIRITGDYTRDRSNARNGYRLIPALFSGTPVQGGQFDTRAGLANPRQSVEAYGLAMNVSAELGSGLTLRSISAWRQDESLTPIDFDSLPSVDVDVPARYANSQVSQEFQLAYASDRLNGLLGFYYLDAKAATQFDVILGTTGPLLSIPGLNSFTAGDVRTDTWSVFGDFTFDLTDQIALSLGGRFTHDRRNSTILRQTKAGGASTIFGGTAVAIATATNFAGEATFEDFSPRASLSWQPNADNLLYASYSQGFKGGSFDPRGNATIAPDTNRDGVRSYQEIYNFFLFQPETVDSYEVGYKGTFMNGDARVALTGFWGDYRNVQIPGSVGVDANGDGIFESFAGVTTNASSATLRGIEFEGFLRFGRDWAGHGSAWTLSTAVGYIDAHYNRFLVNGVDVSAVKRIQNTPELTASGTLATHAPLAGGDISLSGTLSYRSKTYQFETPSPFLDQPGYALADASLIWTSPDGHYTIGLHGKNLTDERYISAGYQFLSAGIDGTINRTAGGAVIPTLGREGIATAFYGNPRQIFISVGVNF